MTARILAFPHLPSPHPDPLEVEPQGLSERILAAAHELYREPRGVSIADIAAAAGVAATDVTAVFGDELGVRRAVMNDLLACALAGHPCLARPTR
jgi:AcrR family transcriptional regulator